MWKPESHYRDSVIAKYVGEGNSLKPCMSVESFLLLLNKHKSYFFRLTTGLTLSDTEDRNSRHES